jgi:hypothetical protein
MPVAGLPQVVLSSAGKPGSGAKVAAINREFHRNWRGPAPADQDCWCLVFDEKTRRLLVRHEWQTSRDNGVDEFEVAEFLKETGAAQVALIDNLFPVSADA